MCSKCSCISLYTPLSHLFLPSTFARYSRFGKKFIVAALLIILATPLFANILSTLSFKNWYVQLSHGLSQSSQHVETNSGLDGYPDRYHSDGLNNNTVLGFEFGHEFQRVNQGWFSQTQIGLAYFLFSNTGVNGEVEQYSLPQFTNYAYHYSLAREQFLAMLRTVVYQWNDLPFLHHTVSLAPFVEGGVGLEIDSISSYTESPLPSTTIARDTPSFNSSTGYNYTLGLGMGAQWNAHWQTSFRWDWQHTAPTDNNSSNLQNTITGFSVLASLGYLF